MIIVRVQGLSEPVFFNGLDGDGWSIHQGLIIIQKKLPNKKTIEDEKGEKRVIDSVAIAAFSASSLLSLQVVPDLRDPMEEESKIVGVGAPIKGIKDFQARR